MVSKIKDTEFVNADDLLHPPTNETKWREAYYWNWSDLTNNVSGFSTIGIVPNENRQEFVFLLFWDDKREFYYKEPDLIEHKDDINSMLREKRLAYKILKPLQTWEISYEGRKFNFNIIFDTRFYLYDFGRDSSASWHRHFEASGEISGEIKFRDGTVRKIKGYGQRDKSWGYRDWHQFDKWYATHFQFENWNCGMRKDYRFNQKEPDLSGSIADKEGTVPLAEFEIETINDTDKFKSPLMATYYMKDVGGNEYRIKAERINKNSFVRFARQFPGGYTELFEQMVIMKNLDTGEIGTGMMEHLRTIKEE
ncbi:MAG: hypothetical protein EU532_10845 [Promethearchaeota archaeon]|nr:MAG: hypothetical protein EU532_10845 [Candidatus Lokiarchaeota archaeon]